MADGMQRRQFLSAATSAAAALLSAGCEPAPRALQGGFAGIDLERGHQVRDLLARGALPAPGLVRRAQVVIAGGGVAGLAAARALRLAGVHDFVLLELEDQPGGNSRASAVNGVPCPMGAHYLPVPGNDAREVQDLLEELGLRQRVAGRWQYDERHLCHSPQERLFFQGQWQEGLLPQQDVDERTLEQYRRFARQVQALMQSARFAMPMLKTFESKRPLAPVHQALDAMTFEAWLGTHGYD
ncbi:MAG: NAD(P)-binding protein, partial [Giesbergeria sp.]